MAEGLDSGDLLMLKKCNCTISKYTGKNPTYTQIMPK